MNARPLFLAGFDPRRALGHHVLGELAVLHLLLHDRLAIQDVFLVSQLFQTLNRSATSPREWLERGWLTVALRDEAGSLVALKDQLLEKALARTYLPFEGFDRGIQLYRDPVFSEYLAGLDGELSVPDRVLWWNPAATGTRFANRMHDSALDGSSGLSSERAQAIWRDLAKEDLPHTRTRYFAYADSLPSRAEAAAIKAWASREYVVALPRILDLQISAPAAVLRSVRALDPFAELETSIAPVDIAAIEGRDCALLSRLFLSRLDAKGIATIRELREFRDLQSARSSGSPVRTSKALLAYLRAVGDIAPGVIDPKVKKLERRIRHQVLLSVVLGVGGIVLTGSPGAGAGIAAIFIGLTRRAEARHRAAEQAALGEAAAEPVHIADFAHEEPTGHVDGAA